RHGGTKRAHLGQRSPMRGLKLRIYRATAIFPQIVKAHRPLLTLWKRLGEECEWCKDQPEQIRYHPKKTFTDHPAYTTLFNLLPVPRFPKLGHSPLRFADLSE